MKKILITIVMIIICGFIGSCTKNQKDEPNNEKIENVISLCYHT